MESEAERSVLAAISSGEDADSYFGADGFVESALAGGQWYFSDGGLTLFANEGEIAPRAVGQVVFTLPYEDIAGCLAEEYAPAAAAAPGSAGALKISPGAGGCEFTAVLDEGGVEFRLSASQSVGSICVNRVSMDGSGGWFPTGAGALPQRARRRARASASPRRSWTARSTRRATARAASTSSRTAARTARFVQLDP